MKRTSSDSRCRRYLNELKVGELSDRVVRQVDVPPSIQLAHASPVQHQLRAVQTTAARGRSVHCKPARDKNKMLLYSQSNHEWARGCRLMFLHLMQLKAQVLHSGAWQLNDSEVYFEAFGVKRSILGHVGARSQNTQCVCTFSLKQ